MKATTMLSTMLGSVMLAMMLTVVAATDIVVPLYSYPGSDQWTQTLSAIKANPGVGFQVIINPSSGPNGNSPDSSFAAAMKTLKSYQNVKVLGYVRTNYGDFATSQVNGEVDQYAAWSEDVRVEGIFFDETAQDLVTYMTTITEHARSKIASATVMFNPGTSASEAYYNIADFVMIAEIKYSATAKNTMVGVSSPGKATIIIYSVPDETSLSELVSTAISNKIGSVYFSQDPATYQAAGSDWSKFVSLMSASGNSASSNGGSSSTSAADSSIPSTSTSASTSTDASSTAGSSSGTTSGSTNSDSNTDDSASNGTTPTTGSAAGSSSNTDGTSTTSSSATGTSGSGSSSGSKGRTRCRPHNNN